MTEAETKAETKNVKWTLVGNRQSKTGGLLSNMKYAPVSVLIQNNSSEATEFLTKQIPNSSQRLQHR